MTLQGKNIAILIAPRGTEDPEFAKPKAAVEEAGGTVTVISLKSGKAETVNNDLDLAGSFAIDKTFGGPPFTPLLIAAGDAGFNQGEVGNG